MSDEHRPLDLERVEQSGDVADQGLDAVGIDGAQAAGASEAAQVRRDGAQPMRRELVAPGQPQLGEAVQQHRIAGAGLDEVHLKLAETNRTMHGR